MSYVMRYLVISMMVLFSLLPAVEYLRRELARSEQRRSFILNLQLNGVRVGWELKKLYANSQTKRGASSIGVISQPLTRTRLREEQLASLSQENQRLLRESHATSAQQPADYSPFHSEWPEPNLKAKVEALRKQIGIANERRHYHEIDLAGPKPTSSTKPPSLVPHHSD